MGFELVFAPFSTAAGVLNLLPDITGDPQCPQDELTFTCSGSELSLPVFSWSRNGTTIFAFLPGQSPPDGSLGDIEITVVNAMLNGAGNRFVAVESTLMVSDASILDGDEICCGDIDNQECETVTVRGN